MNETAQTSHTNSRSGIKIAGITLLFSYTCLFVCIGAFTVNQVRTNNLPAATPTPTVAVTPQILVDPPDELWRIKKDDFSSNIREWSIVFSKGKIEIISGKLVLQGHFPDRITIGSAPSLFVPDADKYYVQADFSADTDSFATYGLVFGLDYSLGSFYVFEINQQARSAILLRQTGGQWTELAFIENIPSNHYPEPNTLSAFMDNGRIDLYLNGEPIHTYVDENPLQATQFGAYVSGNEVRVIVDNFFIYDAE